MKFFPTHVLDHRHIKNQMWIQLVLLADLGSITLVFVFNYN